MDGQPFLPDYYNSQRSQLEESESESARPRVLTVASASTHVDGGPSHSLFETTDAHTFEGDMALAGLQPSKPRGLLKGLVEDLDFPQLALPSSSTERVSPSEESSEPPHTELNDKEKSGLYLLTGIVAGGWLFGKLFS